MVCTCGLSPGGLHHPLLKTGNQISQSFPIPSPLYWLDQTSASLPFPILRYHHLSLPLAQPWSWDLSRAHVVGTEIQVTAAPFYRWENKAQTERQKPNILAPHSGTFREKNEATQPITRPGIVSSPRSFQNPRGRPKHSQFHRGMWWLILVLVDLNFIQKVLEWGSAWGERLEGYSP